MVDTAVARDLNPPRGPEPRRLAETVLVDDGLAAGERICVSPLEIATDGMLVRVAGDAG